MLLLYPWEGLDRRLAVANAGSRGKCAEKYVREEEVAPHFGVALEAIKIDADILASLLAALRESHAQKKEFHDHVLKELQQEYKLLQTRIDAMYADKLDGKISADLFERKYGEWRAKQDEINLITGAIFSSPPTKTREPVPRNILLHRAIVR